MNKNSYAAGYKAGLDKARDMLTSDIEGTYGAACIVLHKQFGFGQERLTRFLNGVQHTWDAVARSGVPMVQVCEEETGILLRQEMKVE